MHLDQGLEFYSSLGRSYSKSIRFD